MKKSNTISYSKSIFLDKNRMEELHSILCKHCKELTFHTTCMDGASIRFDSYRELMSHRNFNGERIQTLQMIGY